MKYSSNQDIYAYKDAPDILINNFNIKDAKKLEYTEQGIVFNKFNKFEQYPKGSFDLKHWQRTHKYLFSEIYPWAGEIRQVTTVKGHTIFCKPEYIAAMHAKVHKELEKEDFLKRVSLKELPSKLAYYHSEYNMVHPFREGNSRSLRAMFTQMVNKSHKIKINYNIVKPKEWIEASISGGLLEYKPMEDIYKRVINKAINKVKVTTLNKDLDR